MDNHKDLFLGFTSVNDLLSQMFRYKQVNLPKLINLAVAMTILLFTIPALENYVWSPFWTLLVFFGVVILDFITAVASSWDKRKFVTSKAIKVPFTILAYLLLFAILHLLSKVIIAFNADDILNPKAFRLLAISTYFLCFAINLLSALKHMSNMGLIPKQVAKFIERFIDIQKGKIDKEIDNNINQEKP